MYRDILELDKRGVILTTRQMAIVVEKYIEEKKGVCVTIRTVMNPLNLHKETSQLLFAYETAKDYFLKRN